MKTQVNRQTVDLSAFPDLVVIYLGMQVRILGWHETYFIRGGMEAIYDDVTKPLGLQAFAPSKAARGPMFSARHRLGVAGEAPAQPDEASERDIY